MSETYFSELTNRSIIKLSGADARDFLQNLISNDLKPLSEKTAVYAALLTPQGKFLFDFFVIDSDGDLLLDAEKSRADDLIRRLTMYKLRSNVTIEDLSDSLNVFALYGPEAENITPEGATTIADPRLADLGKRVYGPANLREGLASLASPTELEAYTAHRLSLGVPEGSTDIQVEKNFLLEANFEELHGVSFSKGCYIGQELTARTKYRAKIRKRLFQFTYDGDLEVGASIQADDKEVATVTSFQKPYGLAMTRLQNFAAAEGAGTPLTPSGIILRKPDYVILPELPEGDDE